ncbi:hypothetical protein [Fuscibacter oryzae]|uniref:Uncharacterized protein n=1 Tax=Fuscibacter oryzae TaxID=2803939 RepID=A0A8J7MRN6_9RHOB|nr:hypothetical protein [Fuscibacter oryzae]MBL4930075.1 hypothetical protein [Fuscibacter oryzae]
MDVFTIFMGLYLLVAIFAGAMTYVEQHQTTTRSKVFTPLAYLICALWPLAVAAMLISMQLDRMAMARRQARA